MAILIYYHIILADTIVHSLESMVTYIYCSHIM